jgi:creatinine amidohydrolase
MLPRVRFAELNWLEVERRVQSDTRVVIPLGATEQHGYLSLCTDSLFVDNVTVRACAKADVLVGPVMPFGCSAFAVNFPGTISLRTATMCSFIEDVVDCLHRQGFRRLVFVTGHGGNEVITGCLSEVQLDRPGLVVHYRTASAGMSEQIKAIENDRGFAPSEHAAWTEVFDFNTVEDVPDREKYFPSTPDFPMFPLNPRLARRFMGDGVQSGRYTINDNAVMLRLLDDCVDALTAFLCSLPKTASEE